MSNSASTITARTARKAGPSPRTCMFLALCCYCVFSSLHHGVVLSVSAASIAVVTRNGVYHHIERRQIVSESTADTDANSAASRLPHTPFTPGPGNGGEGDIGGELQPGPTRKKKRSGFLSAKEEEEAEVDGVFAQILKSADGAASTTASSGDPGIDGGQVDLGDDEVAIAFARLKDQSEMETVIDLVTKPGSQEPAHVQQRTGDAKSESAKDGDDVAHQHEVKEGVASTQKFEHMDIWNEDDEDDGSGFIQPIHFPTRDLFDDHAAEDIDSRVAPTHVAHSEHDYLDDSDDEEEDEEEDEDDAESLEIEWSVDEWEEEFEGDLADWSDWIDEHEELQGREPDVALKIKVKVMGYEDKRKNKRKDESPYQRLFSESWF
ncbi:hypothetical protein BGZ73_001875 [Actinomortierella ambigua]|nr:hypothetical protein BGZ73_001875 [Actinomortierella ambigua]